jgi:hypothetical protein
MIFSFDDDDLMIDFHYEYEAGEPAIHSYSNGDPGHPGTDPAILLHYAYILLKDKNNNTVEVDVLPIITSLKIDIEFIEEQILDQNE